MSEDEKKAKRSKKATTNGTVGLFDPMTLRGMTVRNRIWLPPMDTYSALAQDGLPTPFHYQHYVSRAMGGFGMVIVEATAVTPEGRISPCDLGLWADEQMDAWRWIVADARPPARRWRCSSTMPDARLPPAASPSDTSMRACRKSRADGRPWGQAPTRSGRWTSLANSPLTKSMPSSTSSATPLGVLMISASTRWKFMRPTAICCRNSSIR